MPPRPKRLETIPDKRRLIESMRACRDEAMRSSSELRPFCEAFRELHLLTEAIDRLAGYLTGDPRLFHDVGSTGQGQMLNGIPVKRG